VGMIGIPEDLLEKSGLTSEEETLLAEHTRMGSSILGQLRTFAPFVPIVRWHHERIDGKGYPDHLRADAIPLEAQIVGIANRFDEILTSTTSGNDEAVVTLLDEAESGAFDRDL